MQNYSKQILILITLLFQVLAAIASDSLALPVVQDTIFIKAGKGNQYSFDHIVKEGETLYSISKYYGLTPKELVFLNPKLMTASLPVNTKINIPLPLRSIIRFQTEKTTKEDYIALCYKVRKGDTAYNIAKTRFKMPIDTLLERNAIITYHLDIGQILHVGFMKKAPIPSHYHNFKLTPEWEKEQLEELAYKKGTLEKKEYQEYGAAYCKKSMKSSVGNIVLHRSAPLRSYITIKNPMNNKKVRAKVIGRIPDSVHNDNVVVVVSQKTARLLGAKDESFYVWIKK